MYTLLHDFTHRPVPFSRYTARDLWTRPHIARRMLAYHLDRETDLASRTPPHIDAIADWIDGRVGLHGKHLCDLGCGPGLYATRFAQRGARVTGIDFSQHSIAFAKDAAARSGQDIRYLHADYLADALPGGFDVVTLIYYDYGALSPAQRAALLARVRTILRSGGVFILDVLSTQSFAERQEQVTIEARLMDGFWAAGDYVCLQRTWLYRDEAVALDRYLIVEQESSWQIFNWFQYFTPERLVTELTDAGFTVDTLAGSLAGDSLDEASTSLGVIAIR